MAVQVQRRLFTVDEYYQMAAAGILRPDDRVELLDGEIVRMSPIGSPHAAAVTRAQRWFDRRVGERAIVRVQNPVRLDNHSEPEPDIALLLPRADFYARSHPTPRDVLLIVEVADTSLELDRTVKVPLYARAGIPEVWLADLNGGGFDVYRGSSPEGYREHVRVERGQQVAPLSLPDLSVGVEDLLGE